MTLQEFMYRQKQGLDQNLSLRRPKEGHQPFKLGNAGSSPAGGTEIPVPLNWVVLKLDRGV